MGLCVGVIVIEVIARPALFFGQLDFGDIAVLCAAVYPENLFVVKVNESLFLERVDNGGSNAGKIAYLLDRDSARHLYKLKDLALLRRELCGCFVGVRAYRRHLHNRVVYAPERFVRLIEQAVVYKLIQNRAVGKTEIVEDLIELYRLLFLKKVVVKPLFLVAELKAIVVEPNAVHGRQPVIDSGGKHCFYRLVQSAEVMLLHKSRGFQKLGAEHGLGIEHSNNAFEPAQVLGIGRLRDLGDYPLPLAVAPAERHEHALARLTVICKRIRHGIRKLPVKAERRVFDRELRDQTGRFIRAHLRRAHKCSYRGF